MKINLLINSPNDIRSGYLNIDPAADGKDCRVVGDLAVLDMVDGNECEEIVAHDILDAYAGENVDIVLSKWLSKLSHGGKLSLSFIDVRSVARALLNGEIDLETFNVYVHGSTYLKKSCFTLTHMTEVFANSGYNVLVKRLENYRATIVIERP